MAFARSPMLFLDEDAPALVLDYFGDQEDGPAFTGSWFDRLGSAGNDPNRITAVDLVAVTLLSVDVPAAAAIWILGEGAGKIQALLAQIPTDLNLWSADEDVVADGSPADRLWNLLEERHGLGWVTTGKLCARKRPRLLPIYDSVVKEALRLPKDETFWLTLRQTLADSPEIVARLHEIKDQAGIPEETSLLRILDIAIWMRNHGTSYSHEHALETLPSLRD